MPVIDIEKQRKKMAIAQESVVLMNEAESSWRRCLEGHIDALKPSGAAEFEVVVAIAAAQWRLRRLRSVETALIDTEMDRQAPGLEEEFEQFDEGVRIACAYRELGGFTFSNLARQEEVLTGVVESGLKQLSELRRLRGGAADPAPSGPAAELQAA